VFILLLGVKKAPRIAPKFLIYLTNYWRVIQGSSVSPLPYKGSSVPECYPVLFNLCQKLSELLTLFNPLRHHQISTFDGAVGQDLDKTPKPLV